MSYMALQYVEVFFSLTITVILLWHFATHSVDKKNNQQAIYENVIFLSHEEINLVVDTVVEDVLNTRKLYYRLKDIAIIPDMDEEVRSLTTEIVHAFSDTLETQICNYYTKEYFYTSITRRVQLFLIEYTNTHKPNVR